MTTNAPKNAAPAIKDTLSAWEMARSILTGLQAAHDKAYAEYLAIHAENPSKPHLAQPKMILIEGLDEARKALDADMRQIARANQWEL